MKKYIRQNITLLVIAVIIGTVFSLLSAFVAVILQKVVDIAVVGDMSAFLRILIFTCIYLLTCCFLNLLYATLGKKIICRITQSLRYDVFKGIFKRNISDFNSVNSADYISALTNDIKLIEDNFCTPLFLALINFVELIASIAIMIYFSFTVFIFLVDGVIILSIVPNVFKKTLEKRQSLLSKRMADMTISIKDFLSGFEIIKSYRMFSHTEKSFHKTNQTTTKSKYSVDKITAVVESVSMILSYAVMIGVLFMSAFLIIKGSLTIGVFAGVVQVTGTIVMPFRVLSQSIPQIQGTKPVIERLTDFINYKSTSLVGEKEPTFKKDITVNNVYFKYHDLGNDVIHGANCKFERNKKYAIIGKSGCGKTTLVNLINGYFGNYEGEISFDGIDLYSLDVEKISEMIAVIHQNVYMFDETIYDNICLHKEISKDQLDWAIRMSGVDTFLSDSRNLNAETGENGVNLSGGQKQRIAVARALAQNKPILILDEGTSAIDLQTAYDIESRLLELENLTVITITHSLNQNLLRLYDAIIFMENGNCIVGTFDELLRSNQKFSEFFMLEGEND